MEWGAGVRVGLINKAPTLRGEKWLELSRTGRLQTTVLPRKVQRDHSAMDTKKHHHLRHLGIWQALLHATVFRLKFNC